MSTRCTTDGSQSSHRQLPLLLASPPTSSLLALLTSSRPRLCPLPPASPPFLYFICRPLPSPLPFLRLPSCAVLPALISPSSPRMRIGSECSDWVPLHFQNGRWLIRRVVSEPPPPPPPFAVELPEKRSPPLRTIKVWQVANSCVTPDDDALCSFQPVCLFSPQPLGSSPLHSCPLVPQPQCKSALRASENLSAGGLVEQLSSKLDSDLNPDVERGARRGEEACLPVPTHLHGEDRLADTSSDDGRQLPCTFELHVDLNRYRASVDALLRATLDACRTSDSNSLQTRWIPRIDRL